MLGSPDAERRVATRKEGVEWTGIVQIFLSGGWTDEKGIHTYRTHDRCGHYCNYCGNCDSEPHGLHDGSQATVKCFCPSWQNLGGTTAHKNSAGTLIALLPPVFAAAVDAATAWNGYYFNDMTVTAIKYQHGLGANPATYGNTGVSTYIVNEQAIVYMKDQGSIGEIAVFPADAAAAGWTTP